MTLRTFGECLEIGRAAEQRVCDVFLRAGWGVQWKDARHRKDLEIRKPNGETERVEVKNEDAYADSDNLCIELRQGATQKPSGLLATESSICIHTLGDTCFVYRTVPMRNHVEGGIRTGLYTCKAFGRADNANSGVLASRRVLMMKDWAEEIDIDRLPESRVFSRPA